MSNLNKSEKEEVIKEVMEFPLSLRNQLPIYQDDQEVVLAAITQDINALSYASFKLRSNQEFLNKAIKIDLGAFNFVTSDKNIKNDRNFIATALNSNNKDIIEKACNWLFATDNFKDDKDLILAAIKNNGSMLGKAGKEYKSDKEIVLSAIESNTKAVNFMDEKFFNDPEVMLSAFKKSSQPLAHEKDYNHYDLDFKMFPQLSDNLKNDKNFICQVLKINNLLFQVIPEELKKDRDVIIAAVKSELKSQFVYNENEEIEEDRYKQQDYYVLEHVLPQFQNDKEIVLHAVKINSNALKFASENLQQDADVLANKEDTKRPKFKN